MKRHTVGLLALLLLASSVLGQTITLPKEAAGEPGAFVKVPATTDGAQVRWYSPDKGLQVFPVELLKDSKTAVVTATVPGRYRLIAWTAVKDVPSDPAVCVVVIGDAPDPGPNPPVPPVPPVPPTPSEGKWLYIVYETMDTLPQGQANILTSTKARTYLRDKLKKTGGLPDGEFVIWDKDTDASGYPKEWQERHAKYKGKGVPYLVLSNGKTLWEGPLPKDVDAFLDLLKKQLEGGD